ncbi:collagen alpha-5(VI) chain-like [Lineus longissimus]|uniref:collagen alpha-5(VI) chain-like n=1 Tax=Lineus longissimus TaxID=88925 RepID=UPI00315D25E7
MILLLLGLGLVSSKPMKENKQLSLRDLPLPGGPEKEPAYDQKYAYAPRVRDGRKNSVRAQLKIAADDMLLEDELLLPAVAQRTQVRREQKIANRSPQADEWQWKAVERSQGDDAWPQADEWQTDLAEEHPQGDDPWPQSDELREQADEWWVEKGSGDKPVTPGGEGFKKGCKIDMVFLIDATNSMTYDNFRKIKQHMQKAIQEIPKLGPEDVQVGVLLLSDELDTGTVIPMNTFDNKAELITAIMDDFIVPFSDRATLLGLAMNVLRTEMLTEEMGARSGVKNKVAVILTDGWTYDDDENMVYDEAELLRGMGVTIVTIGLAPEPWPINVDLLRAIGDEGYYHEMGDFNYNWIDKVNKKMCSDPGGDSLRDDCTSNLDIVFVMDSSGSMKEVNFTRQKEFVANILDDLEIGSDDTQVSAVVFSADDRRYTYPVFYLDDYKSKEDVIGAVQNITYSGYSTYLARALQVTREEVLIPERGSRKDTPKIVIVITDGVADDREDTPFEVEKLMNEHPLIEIIAIGVGEWLHYGGHEELDVLTSGDESKVFEVHNFPEIFSYVKKLKRTICRLQAKTEAIYFSERKEMRIKPFE